MANVTDMNTAQIAVEAETRTKRESVLSDGAVDVATTDAIMRPIITHMDMSSVAWCTSLLKVDSRNAVRKTGKSDLMTPRTDATRHITLESSVNILSPITNIAPPIKARIRLVAMTNA